MTCLESTPAIAISDEVNLRVNNLARMTHFYCRTLGFELIGEFPNAALLEISKPSGGHAQTMGLFKSARGAFAGRGSGRHISFYLPYEGWWLDRKRLEQFQLKTDENLPYRIYVQDPEDNLVELIR